MAMMEMVRMDFLGGLGCCQVQAGEERGAGALKNTGSRHHPRAKESLMRPAKCACDAQSMRAAVRCKCAVASAHMFAHVF